RRPRTPARRRGRSRPRDARARRAGGSQAVRRALILDLDDTLYPERRFALSGFAAVARAVEREHGYPACAAFHVLRRELRSGRRAQAFQRLAYAMSLDLSHVARFREVYRRHQPRLRLPRASRNAIAEARRS